MDKHSSLEVNLKIWSTSFLYRHWWPIKIMVIFSDILSFQRIISLFQKHKKEVSLSFCFAIKDSPTSENLCLKLPYMALYTLEHWVHHACLWIVSLVMHWFLKIFLMIFFCFFFLYNSRCYANLFWTKFPKNDFYRVVDSVSLSHLIGNL